MFALKSSGCLCGGGAVKAITWEQVQPLHCACLLSMRQFPLTSMICTNMDYRDQDYTAAPSKWNHSETKGLAVVYI